LSPVGSHRDRALWGLLAATLVLNLATMPAFRYDGDASAWEMEAESLVQRSELAVSPEIIALHPPVEHYFALNPETGRYHSKYGIGNTLLYALPLAFERAFLHVETPTDPATVFGERGGAYRITRRVVLFNSFNALLALLLALVLYRLASLYTDESRWRIAFVLACFYSTFLWNYLRAQTTEIYQCLLFSAALLFLFRYARRRSQQSDAVPLELAASRDLLWSALALGALCLVKLAYLPLLPIWVAAVSLIGWQGGTNPLSHALSTMSVDRKVHLVYAIVPLIATTGIMMASNELRFGSAFKLGYERETNLFGANLMHSVPGYLFHPRWSMLVHFPVLLIALFGFRVFWRRARYEIVVTWGLFLTLFAINSSYYYWKGEACFGPRYLLFGLPAVSLPFVAVLEMLAKPGHVSRRWLGAGAIVLLLGCSTYLQTRVNALEFHVYYRLKGILQSHVGGDVEAIDYLANGNTALIHRDFIAYRDGGALPLPMRRAQQSLSPAEFAQLEARILDHLESNYYWVSRERSR